MNHLHFLSATLSNQGDTHLSTLLPGLIDKLEKVFITCQHVQRSISYSAD